MRIIQLGIVSAFGVLYFVSPRTDAGAGFSLVPYVLTVYLALTLIGLVWSWRRRLPDWAEYGSIFFDISLLMLLMWSFHRQYGQPASFYLKAPTFLYLFIFIALRALRFDPKFGTSTARSSCSVGRQSAKKSSSSQPSVTFPAASAKGISASPTGVPAVDSRQGGGDSAGVTRGTRIRPGGHHDTTAENASV